MIDTNQLLSIAFTMIANFTSIVHVPPGGTPHGRDDLGRLVVGSMRPDPASLVLVLKHGETFWIKDGVVEGYESPDSFFKGQSADVPDRLKGVATMSSNQVVDLASGLLGRLAKRGNPAAKLRPRVESALPYAPFYNIEWRVSTDALVLPAAEAEIDARDGRVAYLHLWAQEYHDPAFAREITNRVWKPDPARLTPPRRPPKKPGQDEWTPTTNEVQTLVPRWLKFCQRLGLEAGSQTNVADVDWEPTFKAKSTPPFPEGTDYKIKFRNGNGFHCVNHTVFGHFCGDAAFIGAWADKPADYWTNFVGKATRKWEDLAADLNARLVSLGAPSNYLSQYTPKPDAQGSGGVSRCVVDWYETKSLGKMDIDRVKTALLAEFDLATGKIKNVIIFDWNLLKWKEEPEAK
jgi:hypothetical protein